MNNATRLAAMLSLSLAACSVVFAQQPAERSQMSFFCHQ